MAFARFLGRRQPANPAIGALLHALAVLRCGSIVAATTRLRWARRLLLVVRVPGDGGTHLVLALRPGRQTASQPLS